MRDVLVPKKGISYETCQVFNDKHQWRCKQVVVCDNRYVVLSRNVLHHGDGTTVHATVDTP